MPTILLATRSAGKVREIRQMAPQISWRGLDEFSEIPDAIEDGATFADNARKKALYYAEKTGLIALADDSGLKVDALGGAPGVHSAHYAGHPRDDAANNRKLVAALRSIPIEKRTAHFRCVMALARNVAAGVPAGRGSRASLPAPEILIQTEGSIEGVIIDDPRGENGFGYDPHFLVPELGKTTAELPPGEKNAISHRGHALRAMLVRINQLFGGT